MTTTLNHLGVLIRGTNAERLVYSTTGLKPSSFFLETDTDDLFVWNGVAWIEVAGGGGAAHDILSATHSDAAVGAVTRGDLIIGNATPAWDDLPIGTAGQLLTTDGNDPAWASFDWDTQGAAAAADMVHTHSADGEGGQLDWDNIWSDAVHDHSADAEGGQFSGAAALTDVPNHVHAGVAGDGGQLDWDSVWSDAVHSHGSDAEGGSTITPVVVDLNGGADALVLDADGDTAIDGNTDDQIRFKLGGTIWIRMHGGGHIVSAVDGGSTLGDSFFRWLAIYVNMIYLNGTADGLVLDADGDTTLSAPTDDQIDIEIAGADAGTWTASGLKLAAGDDNFPNNDGRGLASRFINQTGLTTWGAHFRTGETTGPGNGTLASYSWAAAPFITPGTLIWSAAGEYAYVGDASASYRAFLNRSITNNAASWQEKHLVGRFCPGVFGAIGLRFDDGTDTNYVEIYATDVAGDATTTLEWRVPTGIVTSNINVPLGTFLTFYLRCYYDGVSAYYAIGYILAEDGNIQGIAGFVATITAWVPAAGRAGIILRNDTAGGSGPSECDWFYTTFA